ncbi:pro-neuregulin-2, membrane-bound isoform-like [Saccostrea cucullata]|uniref:pro-neuregulin-2, membrane-bound isoform-like n=1 Tax=Saccostrea cuccullata TaxID=36930 RepID=UPI002ED5A54D
MDSVLMWLLVFTMLLAVQVKSVPVQNNKSGPKTRTFSGQIQNQMSQVTKIESENMEKPRDAYVYNRVQLTLPSSDKNSVLSQTDTLTKSSRRHRRSSIFSRSIVVQEIHRNSHLTDCTEWENRSYCHNGGKCAYIPKLDLKTCRCPMSYTGSRCEIFDLQFFMSQMTAFNPFMFSG